MCNNFFIIKYTSKWLRSTYNAKGENNNAVLSIKILFRCYFDISCQLKQLAETSEIEVHTAP